MAAEKGYLQIVADLLTHNADATTRNKSGVSPLMAAVYFGKQDVADLLIDNGAYDDPDILDNLGRTTLIAASIAESTSLVERLIRLGGCVDIKDHQGMTALNWALARGNTKVAEVLLANEADLTIANNKGTTPLILAATNGLVDAAKLLLQRGADISAFDNIQFSPLHVAAEMGHLEIVKLLLDHGADIEATAMDGTRPLISASCGNKGHKLRVVQYLLNQGAKADAVYHHAVSALHMAAYDNNVDVVTALLDAGTPVDSESDQGETPLAFACGRGHVEVIGALVERGADIQARGRGGGITPLLYAAKAGHAKVVSFLLELGANVSVADCNGAMPIHVAAAYGHADVIDILLQNGAKLVVPENSDMTPMALAISGGHWKLFLALIDKYADAEHAQREGREPITNRSYFSFQLILAKMFCRVGELVEILQGRSTQKDEQSLLATAWTAPRQRPRINQDDFSGAVLESNKKLTSPLAALSVADDGDLWGSSDIDGGYESPPVEIRKLPPGGLCEVCLGIFHQRLGNIPVDPMSGVMEDVISLVVHGKAPQIDESVIPTGIDSTSLWFVHHVSPSSLQSSYDLGCYICRRIWGRVEPGMRDKILAMDTVHVDSETASLMDPFLRCKYFDAHKMRQNTPMESDGVSDQNFWLFHFNSVLQDMLNWPPMEFPGFSCIPMKDREQENLRTVLDSSTGSPRSLHFAASQFSNCLKTHPKCKSSQLWLPTRLICIDEAASQGRVRLVLSQGITPEAYCTLSHCWGKAEFLKLEKSDLTAFYDGIDLASLPKTFRDAIYVTDTLGIRYIWIDSLCIIQDDANDWLREASQMHLVYANSACNICATASDDSMGGLFTERDTDVFSSCDVEIPWLGDGGYFRLLDAHIWTFQVLHPPLNRRAWVVQERLLAPRLLHFGPIQIYWQCLETITSEEFPSGLPVNPATQAQRSRRLLHSDDSNLDGETSDILCSDWPEIVSNYTSAKLSHPEDKIIAFAGITKRFELILKDECSAGLWRNDLEHGLLWHVKPYRQSDRTSTRPLVYRAPSFSWMSVEGRIDFEGRIPSTSPVMNVLSFTVDESPGVIRSASLCVECSLKPMRVYRSSPAVPIWLGKFRFGTPDLRYGLFVSCTVFMDTDGSWEAQYFAMPIQSTTTNPIRLLGLVLEETGMRKGQFKRVGYFRTLGEEAVLLRGQYGDEHTYPCESYDEAAKKHIITIV